MKKLLLPLLFLSFKVQGQELKIIDNFVYDTKEVLTKKNENVILYIITIRYNDKIIHIESTFDDVKLQDFYNDSNFKIDKSLIKKEDLYDLITTKKYGDYSISDYDSEYLYKDRNNYNSFFKEKKYKNYFYEEENITIPKFFTITKNVLILN
jgi:hypothetical protein